MPVTTVSVKLEDLPAVSHTMRAMFRLLHEIEASDPTLLPSALVTEAERARAIVDEWRKPGRHQRRHDRG
jgi:hypothetical protein